MRFLAIGPANLYKRQKRIKRKKRIIVFILKAINAEDF